MRNRLIALLLAVIIPLNAFAETKTVIKTKLVGLGMSSELSNYVANLLTDANVSIDNADYLKWRNAAGTGSVSAITVDASDDLVLQTTAAGDKIKLYPEGDTNRVFSLAATSDTQFDWTFGDATDSQRWEITSASANADDNDVLCLSGGGDCEDHARGGFVYLGGADVGGANAGDVYLGSTDDIFFQSGTGGNIALTISDAGVKTFGLAADANFNVGAATIGFQEAVAGTACSGTATANGTTAVTVSTTCATTGSRIFLSATSDGTGAAGNDQGACWATNIVNGTSFDLDCPDANNNAAYNWVIFHESP